MDIEIERIPFFETEPTLVDENSPLIEEFQKVIQDTTGSTLPVVGILGQSDLRWFMKNGIPGINFGPGSNDNNIHGYDECMSIEDLIQTTKILARVAGNIVS